MSWVNQTNIDVSQRDPQAVLSLLNTAFSNVYEIQNTADRAGVNTEFIEFQRDKVKLTEDVFIAAAEQSLMHEFLAEVLSDKSKFGIHAKLWGAMDAKSAGLVHKILLKGKLDYSVVASMPPSIEFEKNGKVTYFEKVLNNAAKFDDIALFRSQINHCESRVARVDINGQGRGSGWLVGPNLFLTAFHVVSDVLTEPQRISIVFDYKVVPEQGYKVLYEGRRIQLAVNPVVAFSEVDSEEKEFSKYGGSVECLDYVLLRLNEPVGAEGLGNQGLGSDSRGWFEISSHQASFNTNAGLYIVGHPELTLGKGAGPMQFTASSPALAELTETKSRVRYRVNTKGGSSGSPVFNQDFVPLAMHHYGYIGELAWAEGTSWQKGFNQGVPVELIATSILQQVNSKYVENA